MTTARTSGEMANYEESLKVCRDLHNVIDFAEEKAHAKGRAEGLAAGIEKGKAEIARNMKQAAMTVEQIVSLSGLSFKEIETL